jgi:benzoyl-CoA reductase subunit C
VKQEGAQALAARCEELIQDHRLGAVRRWKARTGGLAIGFMPVWAPRELLHAQGALPVGLMGAGDDLEIIRGDAYYQSYICHIPRSTIELGLNGSLDCLDGVLFPATCDVIRNLSGIWRMRFPGKLVRYLDVPQDFDPAIGGAFLRHELRELANELAAQGAKPYDEESLRNSIALYNENRERVRELYELRKDLPWKIPTSELYLVLRAGSVLPVEEHNALLARYRALVMADQERRPLDQARVLLVGSFCEAPPLGLIRTLERAGCYIVDDDLALALRWITKPISTEGDPLERLARSFLRDSIAGATRWSDAGEKEREVLDRVDRSGAEGVLYCAPSFCDPALLDQPMTQKALDQAGVPWTSFKYAENLGQFQVIREQAGTFADSIKLWSEA